MGPIFLLGYGRKFVTTVLSQPVTTVVTALIAHVSCYERAMFHETQDRETSETWILVTKRGVVRGVFDVR